MFIVTKISQSNNNSLTILFQVQAKIRLYLYNIILMTNNDNTMLLQQGSQQSSQQKLGINSATSKKYLSHFQSINTPVKLPVNFQSQLIQAQKNKHGTTLEMYASSLSIIDNIVDSPIKHSQIINNEADMEDVVKVPIVVNVNPKVKQRVQSITQFFNNSEEWVERFSQDDASLNTYLHNIFKIDLGFAMPRSIEENYMKQSRSRSKSRQILKVKLPQTKIVTNQQGTKHQVQQAEMNTDPVAAVQKSTSKLKKMDLLLIQIMKEKKRKGTVPDYFRAIQMKLVQLLQYILQDQPGYFGMSLKEKMKEVLKNLESFKGKIIDGESKINMLRIFFQQFRNLKKQRQEESYNLQNRSKSNSKKSASKIQSQNEGANKMPLAYKVKKNYDTMSLGNRPSKATQKNKNKNNPSAKSVNEEDQWIGSLDA